MKHACHQISRLASESLDRKLSPWERLRYHVHLAMCGNCKNCDNNLKLIRNASELIQKTRYGDITLSDDQREKMHQILKESTGC
ncbi:hypothetical protein MMIC_P0057 [Mariprofundus micogutta]|uniref:Putative zinc-finger domain-containing protein n=1 Tax=Mariprofundus micogutta TaxID=1921010 RepID=A0A1L8CJM8_9PROT|nr:zf-HC2 domain-containing protein [Mariprofundus micogutta]GAV19128.1 hypothetical protein MMIC_P0057 [Mariprofundus micogutta]